MWVSRVGIISLLLIDISIFMVIRKAGKKLQNIHNLLIDRLSARDITGARKALVEETRNSRSAILEKVVQEEVGHWHVGVGK